VARGRTVISGRQGGQQGLQALGPLSIYHVSVSVSVCVCVSVSVSVCVWSVCACPCPCATVRVRVRVRVRVHVLDCRVRVCVVCVPSRFHGECDLVLSSLDAVGLTRDHFPPGFLTVAAFVCHVWYFCHVWCVPCMVLVGVWVWGCGRCGVCGVCGVWRVVCVRGP